MWREMKHHILETKRYRLMTVFGFVVLSLFFIPWNTRISIPAILQATNKISIHSLSPGVITDVFVKEGDEVSARQPLIAIDSHSLEDEIARTLRQYEVTELRSQRRASNPDDLANMQVVLKELQELRSRLSGLYEVRDELIIRAPISGKLVDMQDNLHPGRWINSSLRLAHVVRLDSFMVQGVIEGQKLDQVKINQEAVFIPNEPELEIVEARVAEIEDANIQVLDSLYFASTYGGDVAVREDDEKQLVPEKSIYRIRLELKGIKQTIPRVVKGEVHIVGEPRSFAFRTYDLIATVLIRELGF